MNQKMKRELKSRAHSLNPVIITGAQGLTPALHKELAVTLEAHELIKIRVNAANRDERDIMIQDIVDAHHATLIQQVGHIIAIYRKREE